MQFIMMKIALVSSRLHADTFIYSAALYMERAILIFMTASTGKAENRTPEKTEPSLYESCA